MVPSFGPAAGVRGRLSLPTVGGAAQAHLWHRRRNLPALRRTHAALGRHHRPREPRAPPSSPGRADRAALARSRSRPTVLAEQDCTTTRPIRAVLAAGVVRRALNRDCTDPRRGNCGGRRALSGGGLFALRGALVRLQSQRLPNPSALTPQRRDAVGHARCA